MEKNALAVLDTEVINQGGPINTLACAQPIQKSALPSLRRALKLAQKQRSDLLGCEEELVRKVDLCIYSLTRRIQVIEEWELARQYQYFDIQTALSFRDEDGLPSLAIYSINSGICSFENTSFSGGGKFKLEGTIDLEGGGNTGYCVTMEPPIPEWLEETYSDFAILLRWMKEGTKFISKFKRPIPPHIRQQIADVRDDFEYIFILAEADWKKTGIRCNPIVVGLKNTHAWLIATFDPLSEVKIHKALTTAIPGQ